MVEEADEKALRVPYLNLPAAQRDGEMRAKLFEAGLVVSGADDEEIGVGAIMQGVGAGDGDAQGRECRFGG